MLNQNIGFNSRIKHYKGRVSLEYATHTRDVQTWRKGIVYNQGDIIYHDLKKSSDPNHGWSDDWYKRVGLWAVCMQQHQSDETNMPRDDEIFTDLIMDIIPHIQLLLIHHVEGFNTYLASMVTSFCYKNNQYWWNGCAGNKSQNPSISWDSCGNLVASLDGTHCKKCKLSQNAVLSDSVKYNIGTKYGSTVQLNKDTGKLERNIVNENDEKGHNDAGIDAGVSTKLFLNDNVNDELKKQKIYNLLTRNFNASMKDLIKRCMDGNDTWKYGGFLKSKVHLGNVKLWCLYDDYHQNELLCALLWRTVLAEDQRILMFEILFLSTSEHVRYQHYGQEMAKRINAFAMSNCYDIISVAAVPGHGVAFWTNNGFDVKYDHTKNTKDNKKKGYNDWKHAPSKKKFVDFMIKNMLVFDDTPLYAKFLT